MYEAVYDEAIPSVISTTDSLQNRCFNSIYHHFYYSGVTTSSQ